MNFDRKDGDVRLMEKAKTYFLNYARFMLGSFSFKAASRIKFLDIERLPNRDEINAAI